MRHHRQCPGEGFPAEPTIKARKPGHAMMANLWGVTVQEAIEFISMVLSGHVQTPALRAEPSAGTAYTGERDAEASSKKLMINKQDLEWVPVASKQLKFIFKKSLITNSDQIKQSSDSAHAM